MSKAARPSNSDPALGRRIGALMKSLNENQVVFADRFDVTQATVSRWVRGWVPAREYWEPLSKLAGLSVAEFVLGEAPKPPKAKSGSGPSAKDMAQALQELLPVLFRHAGADRERAADLTAILLEVLQTEPLAAANNDYLETAKILAEIALRRLNGHKPQ